jgi:hypothetical protein
MGPRLLPADELPLEHEAIVAFGLARAGAPLGDPAGIAWPRLIALSQEMGAVAALHQAVATLPEAVVPREARQAIQAMARKASFAQLYLRQRLEQSLDALDAAGVQSMPLKGAAYLLSDPSGTATRPMGDIDLLVHPEQVATARAALLGSGWTTSVFETREEFYAEHHHLPPFDDASGSGLSLELHTEPLSPWHPFGLRASSFWASARPHATRPTVFLPAPREQLLHACLHFMWAHMGGFGAWRLVRDVDALVERGAIDWGDFTRTAVAQRAGTTCYWGLRFAREAAGVAVPDAVLAALAPPLPEVALGWLARHLSVRATTLTDVPCPSVRVERLFWQAMVQPERSGHGRVRPWAR